jgi:hypothetical protein
VKGKSERETGQGGGPFTLHRSPFTSFRLFTWCVEVSRVRWKSKPHLHPQDPAVRQIGQLDRSQRFAGEQSGKDQVRGRRQSKHPALWQSQHPGLVKLTEPDH